MLLSLVSATTQSCLECVLQSLTYGEVAYSAFSEVLQIASDYCVSLDKFYDLGAGAGRAVFTVSCAELDHLWFIVSHCSCCARQVALNLDFTELVGIELLDSIYAVSQTLKQRWSLPACMLCTLKRGFLMPTGPDLTRQSQNR